MSKENSKLRTGWDLFVIILAIYNAILIPLNISFSPPDFTSPAFQIVDAVVDLLFLFDIVFTFRTTYLDPERGEEITDPYEIAYNYVKRGNFWLDLLSSLPFSDILSFNDWGSTLNTILDLLGLFKLLRIFRISKFIRNLNIHAVYKTTLKMLMLVLYTIIFLHLLACIWFYIVSMSETWKLNMDFIWSYSTKF